MWTRKRVVGSGVFPVSWTSRSPVVGGLRSLFPHSTDSHPLSNLSASFFPLRIFDLILSFPLLEDLTVITDREVAIIDDDGSDGLSTAAARPSSLPTFTGSLELSVRGGMIPIARLLLSLPGSIHFRKLTLGWFNEENILLIMGLVAECVNTLESLDIACYFHGNSIQHLHPR